MFSLQKGIATLVCAAWVGTSSMSPLASQAFAQSPRSAKAGKAKAALKVGLFDLNVQGEVPKLDRDQLTKALVAGIRTGGERPTSIGSENDAMFCRTLECRQKLARVHKVDFLIQATVKVEGRDYGIRIEAVDGRTGDVVAERNTKCDICGVTEAASMLKDGASQLREKLDQLGQVAELRVATEPAGARVYVDGSFRGVSPLLLHLSPGKHEVEVGMDGYSSAKRSFSLVGGVRERQAFVLEKQVSISQRQRKWAWASLGTGVAAIIGGATLLSLHGMQDKRDCSPEAGTQDARGNCRYILDFRWFGFGATAVGAALSGWGATMLWGVPSAKKTPKNARKSQRNWRLGVGARSVSLSSRF